MRMSLSTGMTKWPIAKPKIETWVLVEATTVSRPSLSFFEAFMGGTFRGNKGRTV